MFLQLVYFLSGYAENMFSTFCIAQKVAKSLGLKKVIASTVHFRIFMLFLLPGVALVLIFLHLVAKDAIPILRSLSLFLGRGDAKENICCHSLTTISTRKYSFLQRTKIFYRIGSASISLYTERVLSVMPR